jgi:hypothetical protein
MICPVSSQNNQARLKKLHNAQGERPGPVTQQIC